MEPEYFLFVAIEDMCGKAPVCLEHLSRHCIAYAVVLLCQIANVVAVGIHDDVAICLFETHEYVHHLKLPLYDERGVVEEAHSGVGLFEHRIRVFGHVHGRDEVVLRVGRGSEGVGHGIDF